MNDKMKSKICLPEEDARHLITRFEEWIDYTKREMVYLEKNVKEIKKKTKLQGNIDDKIQKRIHVRKRC